MIRSRTLLDLPLDRTIDRVCNDLLADPPKGPVDVWLFEDTTTRQRAAARMAESGLTVRFRSAYKPLIHFLTEEVDLSRITAIEMTYPSHPAAPADRFLIEAYPLAGLAGDRPLTMTPGGQDLTYRLRLTDTDGQVSTHSVLAPNLVRTDHTGVEILRCCGWIAADGAPGQPLETEFEQIFDGTLAAVQHTDWGPTDPCFERMVLRVDLPAADRPLPWFSEVVSFREAMHEDLFFAVREVLGARVGAMAGQAGSTPGQVVPDIRAADAPRLTVRVEPYGPPDITDGPDQPLSTASRPLVMRQIRAELAALGGQAFEAASHVGRPVRGTYHAGPGPAVLITSGQHANETSGPVGALRAARALITDPEAHFALVPVENVDGYELHQHLIVENPLHMHHAARYTARGDDISAARAEPLAEQRARAEALRLSGAALHLNLHGYPSNEWTRPLSGYLPRGFEAWTVPKGFFLILCAQPGWEETGRALLAGVTEALARNADLVRINAAQIACFRAHIRDVPFEVQNGIPCFFVENAFYDCPLTLITEATDETIYDDDFRAAHDAQTQTVLAAVPLFRKLMSDRMA